MIKLPMYPTVAQEFAYIKWIGIEDEERGQGLGNYLMRRMLGELQKLGYGRSVLNTRTTNHRAQLLYTNLGYRVVDSTYSFYNYEPS